MILWAPWGKNLLFYVCTACLLFLRYGKVASKVTCPNLNAWVFPSKPDLACFLLQEWQCHSSGTPGNRLWDCNSHTGNLLGASLEISTFGEWGKPDWAQGKVGFGYSCNEGLSGSHEELWGGGNLSWCPALGWGVWVFVLPTQTSSWMWSLHSSKGTQLVSKKYNS